MRPVGTDHPEGRPGPAVASGDVGEVGDDEGLVVCPFALETNGIATNTVGVQSAPGVDAHVNLVVLSADQTELLGALLVNIVDEAVSRVGYLRRYQSINLGDG